MGSGMFPLQFTWSISPSWLCISCDKSLNKGGQLLICWVKVTNMVNRSLHVAMSSERFSKYSALNINQSRTCSLNHMAWWNVEVHIKILDWLSKFLNAPMLKIESGLIKVLVITYQRMKYCKTWLRDYSPILCSIHSLWIQSRTLSNWLLVL